jgi:hypothetical protein
MSQPRITEYIWLKHIVETWIDSQLVEGNNVFSIDEFYDGGGPNG